MLTILLVTSWLGTFTDTLTTWLARQPFPVVASIHRLEDQKEVYQYRGSDWISPASTWKIMAVASARRQLGSSFRYQTQVHHTGTILDGGLWGDLVIMASGDPTFGSQRFDSLEDPIQKLVKTLKSLGIQRIEGQIRLKNPQTIPNLPNSWVWGDIGNYYGAYPQVFNYRENQFSVYFSGGQTVGEPAKINSLYPQDPTWTIQNLVTTGPAQSGDQVMIYSASGSSTVYLTGTVPLRAQQFEVKGSVHSPWSLFRVLLKKALLDNGIDWQDTETANQSPERHLLTWESPTLFEIGKKCLAESINLYADALMQRAATSELSSPWTQMKDKLNTIWNPFPTPFWEDGSGLSAMNLVQASRFALYLCQIQGSSDPFPWIQWLPQLGKEGTVRSFQSADVPMYVKSGSIQQVRTYAGYFRAKDGRWYSFFMGAHPILPNQSKIVRQFFQSFFKKLPSIVSCPGSC